MLFRDLPWREWGYATVSFRGAYRRNENDLSTNVGPSQSRDSYSVSAGISARAQLLDHIYLNLGVGAQYSDGEDQESKLYSNSVFFVEVDKISPNPYQPRREFDLVRLEDLAESIKQYGVLQPLVVSRIEIEKDDGGLATEYELIAGERRLRAAKIAGIRQVPVIIRVGDSAIMKLELAIIENLQREDLNPVDRARAFSQLTDEFGFSPKEIGRKIGKSREYVANTLRLLKLPEEILQGLVEGKISEGHTRPLGMLSDRPEEQHVLFKEIVYKKITVRDAERIARTIAKEKVRKKHLMPDPEILELQEKFADMLGTRVEIERKENGGQVRIDFFRPEDLRNILNLLEGNTQNRETTMLQEYEKELNENPDANAVDTKEVQILSKKEKEDDDLYSVKNFSL